MSNDNKKIGGNGMMSPAMAAVTGAVVGAGVAVAGTMALKDEKNRKMVKDAWGNMKDQAMGYVDDVTKKVESKKEEVTKAAKSAAKS